MKYMEFATLVLALLNAGKSATAMNVSGICGWLVASLYIYKSWCNR